MCIEYKQTSFDVKNSDSEIIDDPCLESFGISFFVLSLLLFLILQLQLLLLLVFELSSAVHFFSPINPNHT